jgi:hypothetical protein
LKNENYKGAGLGVQGERRGLKDLRVQGVKGNCNLEWGIKGKGMRDED